jgi:molybdopterin-guanine dinucleotide biosynthesis protein A
MPNLDSALIRRLCAIDGSAEAVVPLNNEGLREPLHVVYSREALPVIEEIIAAGDKSILIVLDRLKTREVGQEEIGGTDSFRNVNTPEEYRRLAEKG